jgi:hypothetical protein
LSLLHLTARPARVLYGVAADWNQHSFTVQHLNIAASQSRSFSPPCTACSA